MRRIHAAIVVLVAPIALAGGVGAQEAEPVVTLRDGDRIVLAGSTFIGRLRLFGHLEAALQLAHPEKRLVVRNHGWSGDEVGLQPRPLGFGTQDDHLRRVGATVVVMGFGQNEAWRGPAGLEAFEEACEDMVSRTQGQKYDGRSTPRVVLVSPIVHELKGPPLPGREVVRRHNESLALYARALARVAERRGAGFVDLIGPSRRHQERAEAPELTFNGVHLTETGSRIVCGWMARRFGVPYPADTGRFERVRRLVREKDRLYFHRYRPVNGEYVFGRRKHPFGVHSFPPEMEELDALVAAADRRLRAAAGEGR